MGRDLVTMSTLGGWGRFANQVFQYAFLRIYAKINNFDYQVPEWVGQYLFGHDDPLITNKLPLVSENFTNGPYDGSDSAVAGVKPPPKNVDIRGYFQYQTKFFLPYQEYFRSLFIPIPEVSRIVKKTYFNLKSRGNTIIGFHLRRGDYGTFKRLDQGIFFITPCEWYLDWLKKNWDRFDKPVLFLASDEINKVKNNFAKYNPVTNKDLGINLPQAPFYPDFYTLSKCDVMVISNSSFSFAASMLNTRCTEFLRPRLSLRKFIPYDPWNAPTIFRDEFR